MSLDLLDLHLWSPQQYVLEFCDLYLFYAFFCEFNGSTREFTVKHFNVFNVVWDYHDRTSVMEESERWNRLHQGMSGPNRVQLPDDWTQPRYPEGLA